MEALCSGQRFRSNTPLLNMRLYAANLPYGYFDMLYLGNVLRIAPWGEGRKVGSLRMHKGSWDSQVQFFFRSITVTDLSILIGTVMSPSRDPRAEKKPCDWKRNSLHWPMVSSFGQELSTRIARVRKQLTALHIAAETAYMMPRHVGKSHKELLEESRSQMHLITHMAELGVGILDRLEGWLTGEDLFLLD